MDPSTNHQLNSSTASSMRTHPIFFIHGMWAGPWYWEKYINFFEKENYRCTAPSLRYHDIDPGIDPPAELGNVSILDFVSDLEKEIQKLDSKPIIIGHSMGGLLAQILASRGLAKLLVLLTPATPAGIVSLKATQIKTFASITMTWKFWKKPVLITQKEMSYGVLNLLPPEEQQEVYKKFIHDSGKAIWEIAFWNFDRKKATSVDESKVTCPVLVIGAGKDRIIPASLIRKVAKKYEAVSTYEEFGDHAHWITLEPGWEEVAGYVGEWIRERCNDVAM